MLGDAFITTVLVFILAFGVLSGTGVNFFGRPSMASVRRARVARAGASLVIALLVATLLMRRR